LVGLPLVVSAADRLLLPDFFSLWDPELVLDVELAMLPDLMNSCSRSFDEE
jgi:hypothetical protein